MKGKLVRDKIPAIILKDGIEPRTRILSEKEYAKELYKKLEEEVAEVLSAKGAHAIAEEVADVMEVLDALLVLHKISQKTVQKVQKEKKAKRGGFKKRIFLIQN